MRIIFMGTPQFAVPSLESLAGSHEVAAVITAPDKPAGRGKKLHMSEVKQSAIRLGIPALQPVNLKDPQFQEELRAFGAKLFVVVAFRMLPEAVWSMPAKGTINLHASLLPAYRGAAPINRAVMNGDKETGMTTFFIERDIDTGLVIDQCKLFIGPDETAGSLHDRMMAQGAALLLETVHKIESGKAEGTPQQDLAIHVAGAVANANLPLAPKIFREDCQIDWRKSAQEVHNQIRGLSPYPSAFTEFADKAGTRITFKIFGSKLSEKESNEAPGRFYAGRSGLTVHTGDLQLEILGIQAPGKRSMQISEFLNGYSFEGPQQFINPS
jgi:methionyl-tRNA formyltransferase